MSFDIDMGRATPKARTGAARWLARLMTAVLWAAGSAYLVHHALDQPSPNPVEIGTIPVLWAAVLAAPILAHHALRNGEWLAAGLLAVAAIVGSAWTLSGTIARQSQGADETLAAVANIEKQRIALQRRLAQDRETLAVHQAAVAKECGTGKGTRCDGRKETLRVWTATVAEDERAIAALGPPKAPNAGTKRIAAFVALLPTVSKTAAELEPDVALVAPCLFGLFIELAALAFGFYGFRPAHRATVAEPHKISATVAATVANDDEPLPPKPGNRRRSIASKTVAEADVLQLIARGQPLPSQETLAQRWGCHKGTVSKWLTDFERRGLLIRHQEGRCKRLAAA